jgi:hypothetical protein
MKQSQEVCCNLVHTIVCINMSIVKKIKVQALRLTLESLQVYKQLVILYLQLCSCFFVLPL